MFGCAPRNVVTRYYNPFSIRFVKGFKAILYNVYKPISWFNLTAKLASFLCSTIMSAKHLESAEV